MSYNDYHNHGKMQGKYLYLIFLLMVLSSLISINPTLFASQQAERKKVLVLYGSRPTLPVAFQWDRGIRSVLEASTFPKVLINIEYLDMTHFNDDTHTQLLLDVYRYKYSKLKPDLIITVFNGAVDMVLKHGSDLFPGVPIVFGGVEKQFMESRSLGSNITGYLTDNNYTATLELALNLHPGTRHVVVFSGSGPIGRGWSKTCRKAYKTYEDRMNFTYMIGLPLDVLLKKVANLSAQTVVIALPFLKSASGKEFVGIESLSQIARASNAPVYTFWDVCLGTGIVGGYMKSFEEEGKTVAKLALRILNGEKPADIPLTDKSKFKYMFDWHQLNRWSISEKRLPQGSIVRFKRLSIWEEHRKTFVGAMAIILAQTLALIAMFIQRKRRRLAEDALSISEERYEFAVTGSRDGLWDWNLLSNTVFYSDRFKELLNYASDDFSDTIDSFRSLLHPEDADATWAAIERHLKERVPYNVEYRLKTKSGEYRWFLARGQAIWDRKGLPLRMAGSISDVNARKQAEADIVNRLFFEKMISELSTEFINFSTDETDMKISFALSRIGTFMNVDRCYLFRFNWEKSKFRISNLWEGEGVQKDEIVRGAIVKDVFPWLYQNLLIGKDIVISDVEELSDQEEVRKEYEYCRQIGIQSFIILPIQVSDAPLCAIGVDSIRTKWRWTNNTINRLRLLGEVFAKAILVTHAEQKLKARERAYRIVADFTHDWEYWQNSDGTINYVSPSCERISGYSPQEFMDKPSLLMDIIVPEDKKSWGAHSCNVPKQLKSMGTKFRIQRRDGNIRWIEHVCKSVFDEQGNEQGFRASNRDITKRQQYKIETGKLRSELAHMDRVVTIGTLTSALAHEINQPLTAMRSYAQAALRFLDADQPDYDNVRKGLQGIVADNKRASSVINRLRTLVKKKESYDEFFDLNSIIKDVATLINSEIISRNAAIELNLHPDIPAPHGDTVQIQQVIINLLMNALDAMDDLPTEARHITVSTNNEKAGGIIVSVFNSGEGIDPDKIEAIFETFYTTKTKGMGLGLAICRSIIKNHGGKLMAENNPDRGVTFSFTLPIIPQTE